MNEKIFYFAATALFFIRIWLGRTAGVFIEIFQYYDDMLLVNYADFEGHFSGENLPTNLALLKDMGYPIFLHLVKISGLSYVDWLSVTWLVAAIMTVIFFKELTGNKNKKIWLLIFAYVLFQPVAFTYIGLRIYRNAILTQFYLVTLEMLAIIFLFYFREQLFHFKKIFLWSFALGIIFSWTYYLKEDGIWLLICLVAVIAICSMKIFFSTTNKQKKILSAIALILPLIIFASVTNYYKSVNEKYFGVSLINNRTEGELGKFCKLIYKIKSDERSTEIWAPTDAILQAFEVSETLRRNETLKEKILHTDWFNGDIVKNPIRGDFLTWVMTEELKNSGVSHNPVEQENFLRQVNLELETAFAEGILQKDDRIQLVSSMGGKTWLEIFDLKSLMFEIYYAHIFCPDGSYGIISSQPEYVWYSYNSEVNQKKDLRDKFVAQVKKVSSTTNMNFFAKNENSETAATLIKILRKIYGVLNFILFVIGLAGIFLSLKNFLREKEIFTIGICSFLLSGVYSFAISWFADFLHQGLLITYSCGIISMLIIFELAGGFLFYKFWFRNFD